MNAVWVELWSIFLRQTGLHFILVMTNKAFMCLRSLMISLILPEYYWTSFIGFIYDWQYCGFYGINPYYTTLTIMENLLYAVGVK